MVLPDRIELSTSPLPMECSTTELRQHARIRDRPNRPCRRADPCHKAPAHASARTGPPCHLSRGPIRFPISSCNGWADHDLEFDQFAAVVGFDEIDALDPRIWLFSRYCRLRSEQLEQVRDEG
jgi:hypothetical protein